MNFRWDARKEASNEQKHGVTFEKAKTVFSNPVAVIFEDEAHSADGVWEIIISSCPATKKERKDYEETLF